MHCRTKWNYIIYLNFFENHGHIWLGIKSFFKSKNVIEKIIDSNTK